MPVILQLSTENSIVSSIIRDWTRSWCSHVDIVWNATSALAPIGSLVGARSDVVYIPAGRISNAIPAGVQFRPPGYAPFTKTERVTFAANVEQENMFYEFLAAQVGKGYDKEAIAGLALDRDWRSADKWFCSELAVAALENAGIIGRLTSPFNFISPRDVLIMAEAMGQPE